MCTEKSFLFSIQVIISNKCGAQLFVNGESVSKKRPLYNNSQILIPNNVQFRWIHLQDTAETRGKIFLAKFVAV